MVDVAPRAAADDLATARARANKAAAELAKAETALGQLEGEINDLEAEQADAEQRLDTLRVAAREVAIRRFINADATQVAELDPDINNQARADALSRYATQGNQDAIDDYTAASEDLEVAERGARPQAARRSRPRSPRSTEAARQLNKELSRLEALEAKRKADAPAQPAAAARREAPDRPDRARRVRLPGAGRRSRSATRWGAPRSGGRAHKGVDMLVADGHAHRRPGRAAR